MARQFHKHYTVDEARALLPRIREWLTRLQQIQRQLKTVDERIGQMLEGGRDLGGKAVHENVKLTAEAGEILSQFRAREIQVKDIDRGLVDFPAIIGGREVFLCWEQDEEDIEYWHDLDTGYAGREKL